MKEGSSFEPAPERVELIRQVSVTVVVEVNSMGVLLLVRVTAA